MERAIQHEAMPFGRLQNRESLDARQRFDETQRATYIALRRRYGEVYYWRGRGAAECLFVTRDEFESCIEGLG